MNPEDYVYQHGTTHPELMEVDSLLQLVERLGLPAVIIGATFFYIYKTAQQHREEVKSWQEKDTVADSRLIDVINLSNTRNENFQQALNEQTMAIKELCGEIRGMKPSRR